MKNIYTVITIDTEPDSDLKWAIRYPYSFSSVTSGIPEILSPLMKNLGVKPVYLLTPSVVMDKGCAKVLRGQLSAGAEIGAHLHPEEYEPGKNVKKGFACYDLSDEIEFELIKRLGNDIEKNIGVKAVSYRAGRYGADNKTIESLAKLGYKVDTSVTPGMSWADRGGPDFKGSPRLPYFFEHAPSILEVPITIGGKRFPILPGKWFCYRWLRPSHMTSFEQRLLIDEFLKKYKNESIVTFNMMFHSVEVVPGASPFVRNEHDKKNFIKRVADTLTYLKSIGSSFVTLNELYDIHTGR